MRLAQKKSKITKNTEFQNGTSLIKLKNSNPNTSNEWIVIVDLDSF